jgi:hypothetical protein
MGGHASGAGQRGARHILCLLAYLFSYYYSNLGIEWVNSEKALRFY